MTTFDKYNNLTEKLKFDGIKPTFKLTYDGEPIRLQTPPFYVPFGLRQYSNKFNVSCTLDLSLRGYDEEDKKVSKFLKWYRELETVIFDQTLFNPDQFNSSIKHPNPEYAPLFRIKTPIGDGVVEASVWKEKNEIPEEVYGNIDGKFKGHTAISIVSPKPYVLPNGAWGLSWKLEQLRLFEPKRLKGCLFLND